MKDSELREIFANNLKFYRINHNPKITQEKLCELLNKNKNYIGLLEAGKVSLPLDMLAQIAEILNIKPKQLLEQDGCPENLLRFKKDEFREPRKTPFQKVFRGSCELQVAIIARLTTSHFQSCL